MTPVLFTLSPGARHGARPVQHGHAPALDRDSRPLRGRGARRRADARATHACRAPERGWPLRHAATYGDSGGPPCRRCLSLFWQRSGLGCLLFSQILHRSTPTHSSYWLLSYGTAERVLSDDRCQPRRGREERKPARKRKDILPYTVKRMAWRMAWLSAKAYRLHSMSSGKNTSSIYGGGAQHPPPRTRYS